MTEKRHPFTMRQRRQWAQFSIPYRSVNNWGDGDLPAPYAEGDVVVLSREPDEQTRKRLRGQDGPYFVVTYGPSIDEGDAWYFRVADGSLDHGSDRLHVAFAARSSWSDGCDLMSSFDLVETADPDGLAKRERMLAEGWTFTFDTECRACGAPIDKSGHHQAATGGTP